MLFITEPVAHWQHCNPLKNVITVFLKSIQTSGYVNVFKNSTSHVSFTYSLKINLWLIVTDSLTIHLLICSENILHLVIWYLTLFYYCNSVTSYSSACAACTHAADWTFWRNDQIRMATYRRSDRKSGLNWVIYVTRNLYVTKNRYTSSNRPNMTKKNLDLIKALHFIPLWTSIFNCHRRVTINKCPAF